ncbi:nitroreductase family protein [bacterium]|nr:nitroreductase family protein [bacterium]
MTNFLQLAKERFSVRNFAADPIENEKLELILEAGRVAPTAKNNQPQKVYVIQSPEVLGKIRSVCPCAYNAPLVLAIGYDKERDWQNNLMPGYHSGETDAAIVCTHMMMEAWDLGIGSCWVGWFNADEVHEALGLPANEVVTALLPLGYIASGYSASANHAAVRPASETIAYL